MYKATCIPQFYFPVRPAHPDPMHAANTRMGTEVWIFRGQALLQNAGLPCRLVRGLPSKGIVVAYRDHLAEDVRPTGRRFLVCVRAERGPHPTANIEIVQSPFQEGRLGQKRSIYFPHPSQPDLIPRDPGRADRLETIVYMGVIQNLAPELNRPDFRKWLEDQGLKLVVETRTEEWNNYRDADAVLAVRQLDGSVIDNKPATKLFNAWRAGTPAILGAEASFRHYRTSPEDYLEVRSQEDVRKAILRLRDEPGLYRRMRERCGERAWEGETDRTIGIWRELFEKEIIPEAERWFRSPGRRLLFACERRSVSALRRLKHAIPMTRQLQLVRRFREWRHGEGME